ncbi:MAG: hypothetical protein ABH871_08570 [Pseudomonadota bacterium]
MNKNRSKRQGADKTKNMKQNGKGHDIMPFDPNAIFRSMEGQMSNLGGDSRNRKNAEDLAQQMIYDAWEADKPDQRVALARKALEICPDCADAYSILAEESAESLGHAIDLYQKALEGGERLLGKKFFKENEGHFWGLIETRPYMRACCSLAQCLWEDGRMEEAVDHFWGMLRLNPNDNQGVRDLLMPCLIELDRDEDAEKLFKQYKEDGMAAWVYSRALLNFRKKGDGEIARKSLKAAINANRHVPVYLLRRKKMPKELPGYYGIGDENEAVIYAHGNSAAWKASAGALEWLAANANIGG